MKMKKFGSKSKTFSFSSILIPFDFELFAKLLFELDRLKIKFFFSFPDRCGDDAATVSGLIAPGSTSDLHFRCCRSDWIFFVTAESWPELLDAQQRPTWRWLRIPWRRWSRHRAGSRRPAVGRQFPNRRLRGFEFDATHGRRRWRRNVRIDSSTQRSYRRRP